MTTLKFKCTLLSDVILNQKAASESQNQTLDFIPGSCFLGIVADKIYGPVKETDITWDLFHSGNVIFGDAHPICKLYNENGSYVLSGFRSLRIPAGIHTPKTQSGAYLYHLIPNLSSDKIKRLQLQQSKSGFCDFSTTGTNNVKLARIVDCDKSVAIKSAYDRDKRRSEDEKLFGYESLSRGLAMYFEVIVDNKYRQIIIDNLTGINRIGRSRTAQYGSVEITFLKENEEYKDFQTTNNLCKITYKDGVENETNDCAVVYADGRLIFLDDAGLPKFNITAADLGLNGEIIWERSQVRTFQYAPWNYQRQCFDADRCGFEKGSVFVVKTTETNFESKYVGSFKKEGFGKVIYNPDFLLNAKTSGSYLYSIIKNEKPKSKAEADVDFEKRIETEIQNLKADHIAVLSYLANQKQCELDQKRIYDKVEEFVSEFGGKFNGDKFKSQWGSIRSIAMKNPSYQDLVNKLFEPKKGYLSHGVAMEKWKKGERLDDFKDFFETLPSEGNFAQLVIINLAAQMAKQK